MSFKVVNLDPAAGRREEVVEVLRELLQRAEAGELVDFSYTAARVNGSTLTGYTATDDAHRRLAGVSMLQFRLARQMEEGSEDLTNAGR